MKGSNNTLTVDCEPPLSLPVNGLGSIIDGGETIGYGFKTECTHNEYMTLMLLSMKPESMSFWECGQEFKQGECRVSKVKAGHSGGALVPVEVEIVRVPE